MERRKENGKEQLLRTERKENIKIEKRKRGWEEKGRIIRNKRKGNVKKTRFHKKKRNLKECDLK